MNPTGLFARMPEVHALRKVRWQFFVTLTFVSDTLSSSARKILMFSWLREFADFAAHTHFRRLLWVSRFERGRGLRGHFHLCIAGIPRSLVTAEFCKKLETAWINRTHARAEVLIYDHARDGVGYIMKIPATPFGTGNGQEISLDDREEDMHPTLSNSLFPTMRRGRM